MTTLHGCEEFRTLTKELDRRSFIKSVMAVGGGLVITADPGMTYSLAAQGDAAGLVITVTMRGGMDGLMAVPLLGSSLLSSYRPQTSLNDSEQHSLDGTFGLHKNLGGFKELFDAKELAVIHAVGTPLGTRSHFDDQRAVEFAAYESGPTQEGWQTRFLKAAGHTEILSGFSGSRILPTAFSGSHQSVAFQAVSDIQLTAVGRSKQEYVNLLEKLHEGRRSVWSSSARTSIEASTRLSNLSEQSSVSYPNDAFSARLKLLAALLRSGTPIKTANIEFQGDLDVHDDAGIRDGVMADNFKRLNDGIMAFRKDIGDFWSRTALVTVTEFGRRLSENASAGLDHGWASAMFVMGGNVRGGQVIAKWPGIESSDLVNGDLRVTTDYRDVLASVLRGAGGMSTEGLRAVFPNFSASALNLFKG
ncbi:DUF1501 domain-containing protein [Aquiluna borgnonia]|uniref:DUF1501 domain-containing protein n=1 Tax=Aquiluna borgnonia TaxID=2499157 RepID=A0A7D4UK70_9MICO|nr:DUF1501 domain-containing protein [Aquiluna borgnonia]QKJ25659.1 DUF1501 domain-containing protein [Aquiluna borgnonia]